MDRGKYKPHYTCPGPSHMVQGPGHSRRAQRQLVGGRESPMTCGKRPTFRPVFCEAGGLPGSSVWCVGPSCWSLASGPRR